jgi:hypothetical protein
MQTRELYERWRTERTEAYVWYCGDEVCACTQPRIEKITPNLEAGYPWIHREAIWVGAFHSEGTIQELAQQNAELARACAERGITPKAASW